MKRLLALLLLLVCAAVIRQDAISRATGACPAGASYVNAANEGQVGTFNVTLASLGIKACYYVGVNGKDSNAGTREAAPFLHIPGTPNFTGNAALGPGVGVIIEGGYVAHFGATTSPDTGGKLSISTGGSSGSPLYYGIDPDWYAGDSFARPVFSGDNPVTPGAFPPYCAYDNAALHNTIDIRASYVILDGIEITGMCWLSGTINTVYSSNRNSHIYLERLYQHGWSTPSISVDSYYLIWDSGNGKDDGDILALSVVDGSDSSWAAARSSDCHWNVDPPSPCYSGGAVYEGVSTVWGNIFRHMSNVAVTTNNTKWHDNRVDDLAFSYQNNGQHTNCNNQVANVSGSNNYFYNNVTTNVRATECYYLSVSSGNIIYSFNDVFWGNMNYYLDSAPTNCVALNSIDSTGSQTLYWYNNTMDFAGGHGGGCQLQFGNANPPLYAWNGPAYFANTHAIGYPDLSSLYFIGTKGARAKVTDQGGEVFQKESSANKQGYTTFNDYAPQSASGAALRKGKSIASFCSSLDDIWARAACDRGTTGAASATSGWGGQVATFPAIPANLRDQTAPDAGAYSWLPTMTPAAKK